MSLGGLASAAGWARSAALLWRMDGTATLGTALVWFLKALLGAAPAVVLFASLKRWWWRCLLVLWLPVLLWQTVLSVRACPNVWHWIALIVLSGGGAVLARYRYSRFAIALPTVVLMIIPGLKHGNNMVWHGHRLMERCATNDGKRPINLTESMVAPVYFGIEPFPDGAWLLTAHLRSQNTLIGALPVSDIVSRRTAASGDGKQAGTWWLNRRAGAFEFAERVTTAPDGHYWLTCQIGNAMWFPDTSTCFSSISREPDTGTAKVRKECYPQGLSDMECGIACDPESGTVFFKGFFDGRLLGLSVDSGELQQHRQVFDRFGGPMQRRANDSRLVMANVLDLNVYAPDNQTIEHQTPSGIFPLCIDLCQSDGSVAVADYAGRLRVFGEDADGGYRFEWGLSLFAPRSVAFSPDCSYIAVASGNDRDVWLINRGARKVVAIYAVGPSVRKVTFVSEREFAVVDACTVTSITF